MTTQINITIDSGGLRDKNLQQIAANRFAKEAAEERRKTEKTLRQANSGKFDKKGLESNGEPKGPPPAAPRPQDEPVAFMGLANYPVANGYVQNLGNTGYQNSTNYGTARNLRIYSSDKSQSILLQIPLATYPSPAFKYNNTTYNFSSIFGNSFWQGQPWSYSLANYPPTAGSLSAYSGYSADRIYTNNTNTLVQVYYQNAWNPAGPNPSPVPASGRDLELFFASNPTYVPNVVRTTDYTTIPGETRACDTHSSTTYNSDLIDICLPLGKDTFILYLGAWDYKIRLYNGVQYQSTSSWVNFGNVTANPEYYTSSTYRRTEWANLATNSSISKVDEFENIYINSEVHEYCFLIGPTSVKQIAVPSGLSQKVKTIYRHMEGTPSVTTKFNDVYCNTEMHTTTKSFTSYRGYGSPGADWTTSIVNRSRPSLKRITQTAYNTDMLNAKYKPAIEWCLLRHFGFGRLTLTFHSTEYAYTPAMFAALDNGQVIRLATDSTPFTNYSTVYSNYLSAAPFKQVYINEVKESRYDFTTNLWTTYRTYKYTKTLPVNIYTAMPESQFKKTRSKESIVDTGKWNLQVWDWGESDYCRDRLISLGFTSADLTP